jgi:hypothetical protein
MLHFKSDIKAKISHCTLTLYFNAARTSAKGKYGTIQNVSAESKFDEKQLSLVELPSKNS